MFLAEDPVTQKGLAILEQNGALIWVHLDTILTLDLCLPSHNEIQILLFLA